MAEAQLLLLLLYNCSDLCPVLAVLQLLQQRIMLLLMALHPLLLIAVWCLLCCRRLQFLLQAAACLLLLPLVAPRLWQPAILLLLLNCHCYLNVRLPVQAAVISERCRHCCYLCCHACLAMRFLLQNSLWRQPAPKTSVPSSMMATTTSWLLALPCLHARSPIAGRPAVMTWPSCHDQIASLQVRSSFSYI
ncbi:hypothetical protein COO60DRAFT_1527854 [Scenedesmus sp. NREL 46B-D3]|nr:hypothetical protein COO60DRAFT_1527854 [Scenedesmus sp. NREL 46B-D3]